MVLANTAGWETYPAKGVVRPLHSLTTSEWVAEFFTVNGKQGGPSLNKKTVAALEKKRDNVHVFIF